MTILNEVLNKTNFNLDVINHDRNPSETTKDKKKYQTTVGIIVLHSLVTTRHFCHYFLTSVEAMIGNTIFCPY